MHRSDIVAELIRIREELQGRRQMLADACDQMDAGEQPQELLSMIARSEECRRCDRIVGKRLSHHLALLGEA